MRFAVTADAGRFEWKGGGENWIQTAVGLFARPKNLLSPSHLWMLRAGQTAHSRDQRLGPPACRDLHRDPPRLTNAALLRAFFALPLVTFKIVAAIHWEALRLWLKARLVNHPNAAAANTILAAGKPNDYTGAALPAAARRKSDPRGSALVH
jgi:hypothetical protein